MRYVLQNTGEKEIKLNMRKGADLTGIKFGRLTVLGLSRIITYNYHKDHQRVRCWECLCDCGKTVSVRQQSLTLGLTKSCGCLRREVSINAGDKRKTHGLTYSTEYKLYCGARSRAKKFNLPIDIKAIDISIPEYCPILGIKLDRYGALGNKDLKPSLDRIIPGKGYVKDNVWVISMRANRIKSDASIQELELILDKTKEKIDGAEVKTSTHWGEGQGEKFKAGK